MDDHSATVIEVFCDVVEKCAFMFGDVLEKSEMQPPDAEWTTASIGFAGPIQGRLRLAAPPELCSEMALNVLGTDPDDDSVTPEQASDTLKEILNVTCGNLLTSLAGSTPVFDLTVPELAALSPGDWQEWVERPGTLGFLVDDHPLLLEFQIEEGRT